MAANEDMKGSIDALVKSMEAGFDSVRTEIEKLRQENKSKKSTKWNQGNTGEGKLRLNVTRWILRVTENMKSIRWSKV